MKQKVETFRVHNVYKSEKFDGYKLPDVLFDWLIDKDVDFIVMLDENGRHVSTVEDWQDFATIDAETGWYHLRRTHFTRG